MKVDIQHLSSVVRVWTQEGAKYGDPYDWAATIRWIDKETIEVLGVVKPVTKAMWEALTEAFAEMGIKKMLIVRHTGGKVRERWLDIKIRKQPE